MENLQSHSSIADLASHGQKEQTDMQEAERMEVLPKRRQSATLGKAGKSIRKEELRGRKGGEHVNSTIFSFSSKLSDGKTIEHRDTTTAS